MASVRGYFAAPGYTTSTVAYSGVLNVDIHKPLLPNRRALIFLHGGGWDDGSRTDAWYQTIAQLFALRGFAVFNADYTLGDGAPQTPIDDVKTLVAWVRTNAATYNVDSTRVTAMGVSAGGHLAVMAGITGTPGTSRPDAVVSWSGAHDLEEAYSQGNGPGVLGVGGYLNVALAGNEALYRQYSPTDQITSSCCPLRIVGSDAEPTGVGDSGLAVVQYHSMETAALAASVSVTKRIFTGAVHGLFTDSQPGFEGASDVNETAAWIASTLP